MLGVAVGVGVKVGVGHVPVQEPAHAPFARAAHVLVHFVMQQDVLRLQTQVWHVRLLQPRLVFEDVQHDPWRSVQLS